MRKQKSSFLIKGTDSFFVTLLFLVSFTEMIKGDKGKKNVVVNISRSLHVCGIMVIMLTIVCVTKGKNN